MMPRFALLTSTQPVNYLNLSLGEEFFNHLTPGQEIWLRLQTYSLFLLSLSLHLSLSLALARTLSLSLSLACFRLVHYPHLLT